MGCICHEPIALTGIKSVSTSIPVLEEHISSVAGRMTEGGVDVDAERVPSALMHLAEYYMAVKALEENPKIKVVIFDRMLSIDIPHLISGVEELLDTDNKYSSSCILEGIASA